MPALWRYWHRVEGLAVVRSSLLTARRIALSHPGGPGVGWPKCDADEVVAGMDGCWAFRGITGGMGIHRACDMQPPFPNRGHAVVATCKTNGCRKVLMSAKGRAARGAFQLIESNGASSRWKGSD